MLVAISYIELEDALSLQKCNTQATTKYSNTKIKGNIKMTRVKQHKGGKTK